MASSSLSSKVYPPPWCRTPGFSQHLLICIITTGKFTILEESYFIPQWPEMECTFRLSSNTFLMVPSAFIFFIWSETCHLSFFGLNVEFTLLVRQIAQLQQRFPTKDSQSTDVCKWVYTNRIITNERRALGRIYVIIIHIWTSLDRKCFTTSLSLPLFTIKWYKRKCVDGTFIIPKIGLWHSWHIGIGIYLHNNS